MVTIIIPYFILEIEIYKYKNGTNCRSVEDQIKNVIYTKINLNIKGVIKRNVHYLVVSLFSENSFI